MNTHEAIREMIDRSGLSQRAVSMELGHSPNWVNSTLQISGSSTCNTMAAIGCVTGYKLVLVPRDAHIPVGSLVIDPPSGDDALGG